MTKIAIICLTVLLVADIFFVIQINWLAESAGISAIFHFLGGLFVALLIASFYNTEFNKLPQYLRFLVIVAMTIGIGVIWEFAEYAANQLLTQPIYQVYHYHVYFMGNLDDTVRDLLMDAAGAIVAASMFIFRPETRPK